MSKYTKDQIDKARKMYMDGHTYVTISSETGIPFSSVRYHVRDLVGSRGKGGRVAKSIDLHAIAPPEKRRPCEAVRSGCGAGEAANPQPELVHVVRANGMEALVGSDRITVHMCDGNIEVMRCDLYKLVNLLVEADRVANIV